MAFCIPKPIAEKLQKAVAGGEFTIQSLSNMSSTQRRELFAKYTNEAMSHEINLGFEKAIASSREQALINWVEKTFKGEAPRVKKNAIDKIKELQESGLLDDANPKIFEDLISQKLGIYVAPEEVEQISKLASKLDEVADERTPLGQHSEEYFKRLRDIADYSDSLTPSSKLAVATSMIGRGNMLTRTSSTTLNIEVNTVQGVFRAIVRRIKNLSLVGYDKKLVIDYMKEARKIWKASRFDISRTIDPNADFRVLGEKLLTSQGDSWVHKLGRVYEDIVYTKMLGGPDALFASFARADNTMVMASAYARRVEGLAGEAAKKRTKELFLEAISPNAEISEAAAIIRQKSIFDAQVSTFSQDAALANVSLKGRELLNAATGDVRLGDQVMPFVKTVSNVVEKSLDVSGVTLPLKVVNVIKSWDKGAVSKESLEELLETSIEAGFGITTAVILSNLIKPNDFIGAYPQNKAERELIRSGNATTNSIRVGDNWISLDYLGVLAAPLLAVLYAKHGKSMLQIPQAATSIIAGTPGVEEIEKFLSDITDAVNPESGLSTEDIAKGSKKAIINYLLSRAIPGFVTDLAKATDKYQREPDYGDISQTVMSKIPFASKTLPIKENIFGDKMENENLASIILFGSRVKTAIATPEMMELERLSNTGNTVGITNAEKNSNRVKLMKANLPKEKYEAMIDGYRAELKEKISKEISKDSYKRLSDEEKADKLDKIEGDILDKWLKKNSYKSIYKKSKQKD